MSWVKMTFYEDGKLESIEMHCILLSGKIQGKLLNGESRENLNKALEDYGKYLKKQEELQKELK